MNDLICGDCLEVLPTLDAESIDACVTDPPYALTNRVADVPACEACGRQCGGRDHVNVGDPCPACSAPLVYRRTMVGAGFMGRDWDNGLVAFDPALWREVKRVLKPGAHLLAFGGTRTFHRLTCAIEDAGFEIRDCLMWLYGSGFPKSHNLTGEWQGWGTALKPAYEPIILARKPLIGTVAANVERYGCGAVNMDGGRIPSGDTVGASGRWGMTSARGWNANSIQSKTTADYEHTSGRWPANLILDEEAAALLDEQSGTLTSGSRAAGVRTGLGFHGADGDGGPAISGDSGGASRFFYTAKASRSERNAGLEGMEERQRCADGFRNPTGDPLVDRIHGLTKRQNHHPTVKPIALMRYLCRLITPPGGTIIDPFMGSGSTGCAAALEGFEFVGIEQDAEYVEIARRRIEHWRRHPVQLDLLS